MELEQHRPVPRRELPGFYVEALGLIDEVKLVVGVGDQGVDLRKKRLLRVIQDDHSALNGPAQGCDRSVPIQLEHQEHLESQAPKVMDVRTDGGFLAQNVDVPEQTLQGQDLVEAVLEPQIRPQV